MLSFKGTHFPKDVILYAVFFYVRYGVSYRDLEEIMEERGVEVDHATLNRWVIRYSPAIAVKAKSQKRETNKSWGMDETYIKLKGQWTYLYRAVDSHGDTLDFMLSEHRDEEAATAFFKQTINNNGFPDKVVMDKSGANYAGLANINLVNPRWVCHYDFDILQVKYLNNIIEQDHRFIKKITKPMMGFKAFHSAQATIDGIETAHIIRKGQLSEENIPAYKQFMALAG
ncbi:IS6 family transposase [Bathymodiolus japonicus methanotrophic gill symbiont]|uniref:IS6 family transposase n=1 Tax=Bathymodiolus japonicus methanotrophic gill symbiont TaxID=113269 RepID=UPI003B82F680